MKTNDPTTGHAAMLQWNSTWRHHHLPVPIKTAIRAAAVSRGEWQPSWSRHDDFLPRVIFDHWGSAILAGDTERSLIGQPYGHCDMPARAFAKRHGLRLTMRCTAPWHPSTTFYAFTEPPKS